MQAFQNNRRRSLTLRVGIQIFFYILALAQQYYTLFRTYMYIICAYVAQGDSQALAKEVMMRIEVSCVFIDALVAPVAIVVRVIP